ncbi:MAG: CBS domain-containing protein [Desulfatitalea sp.]
MKSFTIKELMVPLSEYATVPQGATLFEAFLALEKAQEEFDHTKYRHRAILVLDPNKRVIGKLSQLDVLHALQPEMEDSAESQTLHQFAFSADFIWTIQKEKRIESLLASEHCRKTAGLKANDFMQTPKEGEFVDEEESLDRAIHKLIIGNHLSLLVTRGQAIVGILRLTDVFAAIFHMMRQTEAAPAEDSP